LTLLAAGKPTMFFPSGSLVVTCRELNRREQNPGHSFRVGAAFDLLDKNIPLEKIMLRGGWKSETSAIRYLQSWNDSNWLIIN